MNLNVSRRLLARGPPATRSFFTRSQKTQSSVARTALSTAAVVTGTTLFLVYYFDSRSAIHRYVFAPLLRATLDAETSHKAAVKILRTGWAPKDTKVDDECLAVELWGRRLSNPIGLAAGFDKDGEAIDGLFDLGFGWVEIGSVTPQPQPGNPRPRVFHLPDDDALINRYGFPSQGHIALLTRLRARARAHHPSSSHLLSINLGKNKSSPLESSADFVAGVRVFAPHAPVLVINVSSPNTPGLRALQGRAQLEQLLAHTTHARDALPNAQRARIVLKITCDLTDDALHDLAEVVRASTIDGVIVSNTTITRPGSLLSPEKHEQGGLSGRPLKPLALHTLSLLRTLLPASIPLIGCGGISSGADALEFARAGASAVQLYTAFGYGGVGTARRIKDEVVQELQSRGTTWEEITRDAVARFAWKGEDGDGDGDGDRIRALISEAERLKGMLDDFARRVEEDADTSKDMAVPPEGVSTLPPVPAVLS